MDTYYHRSLLLIIGTICSVLIERSVSDSVRCFFGPSISFTGESMVTCDRAGFKGFNLDTQKYAKPVHVPVCIKVFRADEGVRYDCLDSFYPGYQVDGGVCFERLLARPKDLAHFSRESPDSGKDWRFICQCHGNICQSEVFGTDFEGILHRERLIFGVTVSVGCFLVVLIIVGISYLAYRTFYKNRAGGKRKTVVPKRNGTAPANGKQSNGFITADNDDLLKKTVTANGGEAISLIGNGTSPLPNGHAAEAAGGNEDIAIIENCQGIVRRSITGFTIKSATQNQHKSSSTSRPAANHRRGRFGKAHSLSPVADSEHIEVLNEIRSYHRRKLKRDEKEQRRKASGGSFGGSGSGKSLSRSMRASSIATGGSCDRGLIHEGDIDVIDESAELIVSSNNSNRRPNFHPNYGSNNGTNSNTMPLSIQHTATTRIVPEQRSNNQISLLSQEQQHQQQHSHAYADTIIRTEAEQEEQEEQEPQIKTISI